MALDLSDVRRRISRMRGPDISTDDLAPAMDRAGRTLGEWRRSTEAALASLADMSFDSLPKVSLDSLPGRRRPSPIRRNGPVVALVLLGILAGLTIGWWMGRTARLGPARSPRMGGWRGRGRGQSADDRDGSPAPGSRPADDDWTIARQSPAQSAGPEQLGAPDSADGADRQDAAREPNTSSSDAWHGVGPGRPGDPVATPELVSRTVRGD